MPRLVLGRMEGETVVIGDDIRVRVVRAQNGRVRLAIDAPSDVLVDREEVRARRFAEADDGELARSCEPAPLPLEG